VAEGNERTLVKTETCPLAIAAGSRGRRRGNLFSRQLPFHREVCPVHALAGYERECCRRHSSKGAHARGTGGLLDHRLANIINIFGLNGRKRARDVCFGRSGIYADYRFPMGLGPAYVESLSLPHRQGYQVQLRR
jgi:hypothetical protein